MKKKEFNKIMKKLIKECREDCDLEHMIADHTYGSQSYFFEGKAVAYKEMASLLELIYEGKGGELDDTTTEEAIAIIKKHNLLNYVIKNKARKCASMYKLTEEEIEVLKKFVKEDS